MTPKKFWLAPLFAVLLMAASTASAQFENPDVQSPEEIAHAHQIIEHDFANAIEPEMLSAATQDGILQGYTNLDPNHLVPTDLLKAAVVYFDANKKSFPNQDYLTVVDFNPRSDHYRFYLVNLKDGSVERFHTTHGIHSDENGYAKYFSNIINSGQSSLGYVRTAEVYNGKFKRSLRLDGLSSTNSNIRDRAVVFHGWNKVKEANVIQGLSWGCITLDYSVKDGVLDKIKNGSLMYVGVAQ